MYAVLSSGGKQYRVEPGSTLTVEKLAGEAGASVTFDRVLLIADGDQVTIGTPTVPGASISATVLGEELGPKIVVFKFKQKVKYRRRTGHRQHLTRVRIDQISADGSSRPSSAAAEAEAPPPSRARKPRAANAAVAEPAEPAEAAPTPHAGRSTASTDEGAARPARKRTTAPKE